MSKAASAIYLVSLYPQFSKEHLPLFNGFDAEHSAYLYENLVLNSKEIFEQLTDTSIYYCFDEKDIEYLPDELKAEGLNLIYGDTANTSSFLRYLNDKLFDRYENNLLIFSNVIGVTPHDIKKYFSMLQREDDAIIIGRSDKNLSALTGFNSFPQALIDDEEYSLDYERILVKVCKSDSFVHTINNFLMITGTGDFKRLYAELSKKESITYCSQKMHERFTNLFIEYKELLK